MSNATVELDIFGSEKQIAEKFRPMDQRNSIRGIQSAISRLSPQLLRSVIASGAGKPFSPPNPFPPSPTAEEFCSMFLPPPSPELPVLNQSSGYVSQSTPGSSLLTIFYNGTVTVFDVAQNKAEGIIKLAEAGIVAAVGETTDPLVFGHAESLLKKLNGGMPIARRKSLERFLEKRKQR